MNVDLDRMLAAADHASELLKSLGNRHRLLILCQLTEGERSVGDLAAFLELRDSTVSQHLSLLRKDGLVQARRDGQTIWYSIVSPPARRVLATLFEIFCKPTPLCAPRGKAAASAGATAAPATMTPPSHPAATAPATRVAAEVALTTHGHGGSRPHLTPPGANRRGSAKVTT